MLLRALFVNGTVGVGKTTVGTAVAQALADAGHPVAFVDLDRLRELWPAPTGDRFNTRLAAENLACVAKNGAHAGATTLVVAGVIESPSDLTRYADALAAPLTIVRLVAPPEVVEERLRRRHDRSDVEGLRWHLDRAPELDAILARSTVPMTPVPCTAPPGEVAAHILDVVGWQSPERDGGTP